MIQWNWDWLPNAVGGAAVATILGVGAFFARQWFLRAGATIIQLGDRVAPTYITRGSWDVQEQRPIQSSPRFMNFMIPITIENRRRVELTVRIKNVWFRELRPELHKGGGFRLPGTLLEPAGVEVRDTAGNIHDPVRIAPNGIVHFTVTGTATSPVCHVGPFEAWRFAFIDWSSSPVDVSPLIYEVTDGRSYSPEIDPTFPLPPHYPEIQKGWQ